MQLWREKTRGMVSLARNHSSVPSRHLGFSLFFSALPMPPGPPSLLLTKTKGILLYARVETKNGGEYPAILAEFWKFNTLHSVLPPAISLRFHVHELHNNEPITLVQCRHRIPPINSLLTIKKLHNSTILHPTSKNQFRPNFKKMCKPMTCETCMFSPTCSQWTNNLHPHNNS